MCLVVLEVMPDFFLGVLMMIMDILLMCLKRTKKIYEDIQLFKFDLKFLLKAETSGFQYFQVSYNHITYITQVLFSKCNIFKDK